MEEDTSRHIFQNRRIHGAVMLVLLVLAAFLFVQTVNAIKSFQFVGTDVPPQATISVSGTGEVFAVPNMARFTFSVVEETQTVAQAQDTATKKGNRAISYLKENGVEEKDIKTVNYSVRPVYEFVGSIACSTAYCPPRKRQISGFEVRQTVEVKVRDTQKAGVLLSGLGEIGVSEISGLDFTIEDDEALRRKAREKAISDAREKAEALADDLGVKIVRIVNFSESGNIPPFARFESVGGVGDNGAASVPEIPTGENKITSRVNITYEIR